MNAIDKLLEEYPDEEFLKVDGFDEAILGYDKGMRLIYDTNKIISILTREMDYDDALEYFYYNIEGAYMGEKTPIFVQRIDLGI